MLDEKVTENTIEQYQNILKWSKIFWNKRMILIRSVIIAFLLGLFIVLFSVKEYNSWTTIIPQTTNQAGKLGGLSSLAAMAGFNLDLSGGDDLSPSIYPQIVGSVPFQLELMNSNFHYKNIDETLSLYDYYEQYARKGLLKLVAENTIGLPGKLLEARRKNAGETKFYENKPITLSYKQDRIRKQIAEKITVEVDIKNGFITLRTSFPEAELSAQVANKARELLQQYITSYKIGKATEQLVFIEERYREKETEFLAIQEKLAQFRDQNKNVTSAVAATGEERLRSEYNIAQTVYNELAKQLEQARIRVKEDTPVFSVIQPAIVPVKYTKPQLVLTLTVWIILGLLAGSAYIVIKHYSRIFRVKWNE